ncbi:hypothetical protein G6O69_26920 [Pseudenhygromyxa sp. WMMC2535]|uniref:hypothetical protein n=1 Tax=Pseudenhygromyxa sp. WMMC2535 TaxID=2712867 RepID=UPI001552C517|nr:hypothetical protein [Pseudenhygromyxa sp. WMMC2535]NVB41500.1 hypothetical protein [Pseudenhygromyxa sp. WMMC2535]
MGIAAVTSLAPSACSLDAEPSDPCGAIDFTPTTARSLEDASTVMTLSRGDGWITILRACPELLGCAAELRVQRLYVGAEPDQLLLSGSGRWLSYRVGASLFRVDLEADSITPQGGPGDVGELVGSLRGGDWIVYRSWGEAGPAGGTDESELWAYYLGELPDTEDLTERPHFRLDAGLDLRVAALGHRHVVARRLLGDGREELYLIRVAPARNHDVLGGTEIGVPLELASGQRFSRILITEGPSPRELGESEEFLDELPLDVEVVATSGGRVGTNGPGTPITRVFRVSDRQLVDTIHGADVRTSMAALEDVQGLSAVSPDGSHLIYLTERGSLALHDLEDQRSCMLRPAASGFEHVLAGFGADGTIYFESIEGSGKDQVYAYDAATRELTPLTHDEDDFWRLYAVPPAPHVDEDGRVSPWVVVANAGLYAAQALAPPRKLDYGEAGFLPRGDAGLWLLEAADTDTAHRLSLRRIQPQSGPSLALTFDTQSADPSVEFVELPDPNDPNDPNGGQMLGARALEGTLDEEQDDPVLGERFTMTYGSSHQVCVSASQATNATTPWSGRCSNEDRQTLYLDTGLPEGEQPR